MEAYAHARSERPDAHLLTRARLVAEMGVLSALLAAVGTGDRLLVERHAATLRRLEQQVHDDEEAAHDYRHADPTPARRPVPVVVPPPVVEDQEDEEDEDVAVMFAPTVAEDEPQTLTAADDQAVVGDAPADVPADAPDDLPVEDDRAEPHEVHGVEQDDVPDTRVADEDHDQDAAPVGRRTSASSESTTEIPVGPRTPERAGPTPPRTVHFDDEEPGPEFEPGYQRP
jgi:hypothetical protein